MFDPTKFHLVTDPEFQWEVLGLVPGQVPLDDIDELRAPWDRILTRDPARLGRATIHITKDEGGCRAGRSVIKVLNGVSYPNSHETIVLLDSIIGAGHTPEERVRNGSLHLEGLIYWLKTTLSQVRWLWVVVDPRAYWNDFPKYTMPAEVKSVIVYTDIYYSHGHEMRKGANLIAIPLQRTIRPLIVEPWHCLHLYYRGECRYERPPALPGQPDQLHSMMEILFTAFGDENVAAWEAELTLEE